MRKHIKDNKKASEWQNKKVSPTDFFGPVPYQNVNQDNLGWGYLPLNPTVDPPIKFCFGAQQKFHPCFHLRCLVVRSRAADKGIASACIGHVRMMHSSGSVQLPCLYVPGNIVSFGIPHHGRDAPNVGMGHKVTWIARQAQRAQLMKAGAELFE